MEYIYQIINLQNGKFYLGRTVQPKVRKRQHFNKLRKQKHHCTKLQRAWNKYNELDFVFVIIETCYNSIKREQELLNKIDFKDSYNISKSSIGGAEKEDNPNWKGGKTFCKCGKRIQSKSKTCMKCKNSKGKNNSFYGKKHTDETKDKIRKARLGTYNGNQQRSVIIEEVEYISVSKASKKLGVVPATILYRIKSSNPKYKNYKYK